MAHSIKKKKPKSKEFTKEKLKQKRKLSKQLLKEKRARLVVKNLPFNVTEPSLKEYFEKYGEITGIDILKKPDGKLVGCAFLQFKLVQNAAKAQFHTNKKPFMERNIIVDFAKPKNTFEKQQKEAKQNEDVEVIEVKDEKLDTTIVKKEEENETIQNDSVEITDEKIVSPDSSDKSDSEDDHDASVVEEEKKVEKFESHDVNEGKTIFIKNIPFDATNEDLKECMRQFGRIYYALICVDKLTEHSKGTAFVKFVEKEDAEKALSAGTELKLLGNILDCHPAIDRNSLKEKLSKAKEHLPKDSRNLYLVKEGVILAGSKAAEGVSTTDMSKRLQLEQYKTQMLRNLNMYVSRDRLIIHNLPSSWDDRKLKILFEKYAGQGAVIREAKIMRDMRKLDAKGHGVSKEHGFVTFTTHQHALNALRSLNNNPNIFSTHKRPIVAFSIENKSMVKAKQRRMEKSQLKNPNSKRYDPKLNERLHNATENEQVAKYTGVTAKQGVKDKMRSRYKLNVQAKMHSENVKKEKRRKKNAKKSLAEKKLDFIKQDKQKINKSKKGKESDSFGKMVNQYKTKLMNANQSTKNKWYSGDS